MAAERGWPDRLLQQGPLTWLLAVLAGWALLAWLAALAGMGRHLPQPPLPAAQPLPQPRAPGADRIGPLAQYSEAAARPLFTEDRRPRSFLATGPETADGAAAAQSLDFVLTGVLLSPQVRLAILQPSGGGASQRVREGKSPDGAAGWRLVALEPRRATFAGPGGQTTLELRTFGVAGMPKGPADAAAAPAPAAPAPAPAADAAPPPQTEQERIEAIRKRIEARRAQIRAQQQNAAGASSSSSPPP